MSVKEFDTPRERFIHMNTMQGLSWRKIAALPEYEGVSHGVIYNYAVKGIEPKNNTQRRILGLKEVIEVPVLRDKLGQFASHKKESTDAHDKTTHRHTSGKKAWTEGRDGAESDTVAGTEEGQGMVES